MKIKTQIKKLLEKPYPKGRFVVQAAAARGWYDLIFYKGKEKIIEHETIEKAVVAKESIRKSKGMVWEEYRIIQIIEE